MAGLTGAVSEEDRGYLSRLLFFSRECRAESQWNRSADNACSGDKSCIDCNDMHPAALASTVAGGAAGDLRHQAADVRPFRDGMGMGPMPAENVIVPAKDAACADGNCFLADSQVKQANDLPRCVKRRELFLEGANQPHPA